MSHCAVSVIELVMFLSMGRASQRAEMNSMAHPDSFSVNL